MLTLSTRRPDSGLTSRLGTTGLVIALRVETTYDPGGELLPPPRLACRLTRRQCEVAILLANGVSDKDIAFRLELAPSTIPTYVKRIGKRLGLNLQRNLRIQITRVVVFAYADVDDIDLCA